jgi:hypothetical protein
VLTERSLVLATMPIGQQAYEKHDWHDHDFASRVFFLAKENGKLSKPVFYSDRV